MLVLVRNGLPWLDNVTPSLVVSPFETDSDRILAIFGSQIEGQLFDGSLCYHLNVPSM